ncbi:MAG TPA: hypothetical protein VK139_04830 [Microbacteriaceae bacterium]|nr:hypothetical protein [Microbacteriaceae bacterium]
MTDSPNDEFELDDDALEMASGGDGISTSGLDWSYHSVIHSGDDNRYIAKTKLSNDVINTGGDNLIYSIQAVDLVSNFSTHHLDATQSGVNLAGHTGVDNVIGI